MVVKFTFDCELHENMKTEPHPFYLENEVHLLVSLFE